MATKSKPTKKQLTAAVDAGVDARARGESVESCPESEGPLRDAWIGGWNGRDALEAKQAAAAELSGERFAVVNAASGNDSSGEVSNSPANEVAPFATVGGAMDAMRSGSDEPESDSESEPEPEHDFDDEDVVRSRESLIKLMLDFDNCGVLIVEEQWRALTEVEQSVALTWVEKASAGVVSAVPEFLRRYASQELLAKSAEAIGEQQERQISLMPCEFKKPSRSKLDENHNYKVTLGFKVPRDSLRLGRAGELFVDAKVRAEFGTLSVSRWGPTLPGVDNGVITCEVEILKMSVSKSHYLFSFRVSQDVITIEDAMEFWDIGTGSIRLEKIGDAGGKEESDGDEELEPTQKQPLPGQMTLFDDGPMPRNRITDANGEFTEPDEYHIRSQVPKCETIFSVGQGPNNRFYVSASIVALSSESDDETDVLHEADWGNPEFAGDGHVSVSQAIQYHLGKLIDYGAIEKLDERCVDEWRKELKRLADGGEPYLIPDE